MRSDSKNVLVIGNGFDLHHGMMTSYADLLCFFIAVRDNTLKHNIDEEIREAILHWVDNSFFDYFVSEYEDRKDVKTWIDLEKGIKQYIKTAIDYFEHLNRRIRNKEQQSGITRIGYHESTQEIGHMLINSHAIGKTEKDHIEISKKFITFQGLYDIDAIISSFAEELNGLEEIVAFYLEKIEPIIREKEDRYQQYNQIQRISPAYVISFNYTKTICDLYKINDTDVDFIHGNLIDKNVVLGYDDTDRCEEEIVFKKYYRRIIKHTDVIKDKKMQDQQGAFLDGRVVYIFGHSLDISDEDILRPLLEKYQTVIFYLDDNDYAKKIRNLFLLLEKDVALTNIYSGSIRFERIIKDNNAVS